ncbi:MAG: sigma-54-dependent Fis family transcriptional regulator [Archangium sp.]|nr:sigma-54-dependent Fis family transcriptional regulator [Archangium sp.]
MSDVQPKVLLIDDDKVILRAFTEILKRAGFEVVPISDPLDGVAIAKDGSIDVVVTDITMPNLSGIEVLRQFKAAQPDLEVIVITGNATVETASEAVRLGAFDYLTKPLERVEDLAMRVSRAAERRVLKRRTVELEKALDGVRVFEGMIGQSAPMQAVFKLVETVAPTTATVLIRGETGTGKELVARALHYRGPRKNKPFVAVNCSALTETLLESELFGHVKGAFTGAVGMKRGLFEAADGGTLFLDEIGDISAATQVKLLRVLQEGEVRKVGSNDVVKVDTRVIAATHVDLEKAKAEGEFREDLYYRLNVITLTLPSLRDRPTDIPLVAQHFVDHYAKKMGKKVNSISSAAMELLLSNAWTGNVRELQHAIERAVILAQGETIDPAGLPEQILNGKRGAPSDVGQLDLLHLPFARAKELTVRAFERHYISKMLEKTSGNISAAALASGMDRSNFRRAMKECGLRE